MIQNRAENSFKIYKHVVVRQFSYIRNLSIMLTLDEQKMSKIGLRTHVAVRSKGVGFVGTYMGSGGVFLVKFIFGANPSSFA